MKHEIFSGVCTALATPFCEGKLDLASLAAITERQVDAGVSAVCVAGTTGEAATLSEIEWQSALKTVTEAVSGRIPVVVGVGTPSTEVSCRRASFARASGADALLVVTPYYNKGTSDGLVRHFHEIATAGDLPVIAYNVPSRTGRDLTLSLYRRLAEHPLILGVKEAGGGFERLYPLIASLGERLSIYTGNDSAILPAIAMGCRGVVSVLSNLLPRETVALTDAILAGRLTEAQELQYRLLPLIDALFAETNPAPLKCAMELLGHCTGELRLPLAPVSAELRAQLAGLLEVRFS